MKTISPTNIKRFIAAAGLALAIPLTAVAFQGHQGAPGACHGGDGKASHGRHASGGEMGPHYLRGLNLTEVQRDKVFEVMHAQAPLMREKAKAHQAAEAELRKLAAGPDFSEAKARGLADNLGKSVAEMALTRAKSDRQIFDILTPEQRQQLAEMKPGGDGKRSPPAH